MSCFRLCSFLLTLAQGLFVTHSFSCRLYGSMLHPTFGVLVRCLYSGLVGGLPFTARVALLACVGGLAFVVCAFGGFLP